LSSNPSITPEFVLENWNRKWDFGCLSCNPMPRAIERERIEKTLLKITQSPNDVISVILSFF
jgi:hypothetical protein